MECSIPTAYAPGALVAPQFFEEEKNKDRELIHQAEVRAEQKPFPDLKDVLEGITEIQKNSNEWTREELKKTIEAFDEFKQIAANNLLALASENLRLQALCYNLIAQKNETITTLIDRQIAADHYIKLLEKALNKSQARLAGVAIEFLRHTPDLSGIQPPGTHTNPFECIPRVNACLEAILKFNRVLDQKLAPELALIHEKTKEGALIPFYQSIIQMENADLEEDSGEETSDSEEDEINPPA